MTFKPGDVVLLSAGGPPMTVESSDMPGGGVDCVWFVADETGAWTGPFHRRFPEAALSARDAAGYCYRPLPDLAAHD